MHTVTIVKRNTSTAIGHKIGCADTSLTRLIGLLGRNRLAAGEGIWIHPCSGVHTFGMKFAIDVVGLDREMRVVKLWRRLKPHRLTSISTKVHSVLELASGEIDARSLGIGQALYALPRPYRLAQDPSDQNGSSETVSPPGVSTVSLYAVQGPLHLTQFLQGLHCLTRLRRGLHFPTQFRQATQLSTTVKASNGKTERARWPTRN